MDEIDGTIKLLDHGYLKFIESWGSDERIVEAARMSTGKGFLGWGPVHHCSGELGGVRHREANMLNSSGDCQYCGSPVTQEPGDEKLLRYLWEHKHATPFEMGGIVIEVKAPILVFRQWHRHRTQSYNEMSARYTPLPDENYIPSIERLMMSSKTNKQAGTIKGAEVLTEDKAREFRAKLADNYARDQYLYDEALQWGVPKELARVHLPVGRYSRMRACANLRNWLAFLTLRWDAAAQWEEQQYAGAVAHFIKKCFPRTFELFVEGR